MVSGKTLGGVLVGVTGVFTAIMLWVINSLGSRSSSLGCISSAANCQQVSYGLSASYVAVGFLSACFSMGLFFLFFYKDKSSLTDLRNERLSVLHKVLTDGERNVLDVLSREKGILQSTLRYRTNLTPGRVSQIVNEFESKGLLLRKPAGKTYKLFLKI